MTHHEATPILDTAFSYYKKHKMSITELTKLGGSFEHWFSTHFVRAMIEKGYLAVSETGYADFGIDDGNGMPTKKRMDARVYDPSKSNIIAIEMVQIHNYTQNKWRKKIEADIEKLAHLPKGVVKLLVIVRNSITEKVLADERNNADGWDWWFDEIEFREAKEIYRKSFSLGTQGEFALQAWDVGSVKPILPRDAVF